MLGGGGGGAVPPSGVSRVLGVMLRRQGGCFVKERRVPPSWSAGVSDSIQY